MTLQPDGFIGTALAAESMRGVRVLLHGPIGCRRDIAFISNVISPEESVVDRKTLSGDYYLDIPRAPCTQIQPDDYVSGATYRLKDALRKVADAEGCVIAVISTPGTSLIGDSVEDTIVECGLRDRAVAIDADYISMPLSCGFDKTLTKLLKWLKPEKRETRPGTVNILGTSVFMRDWPMVLDDVRLMLEKMGLEVISAPGTDASVELLTESVNAEYNIVVCSEYCRDLKQCYEEDYGVTAVDPHKAPVGVKGIRDWIQFVADATGRDPSGAFEVLKWYEDRAFHGMRAFRGFSNFKGNSLAIEGDSTIVLPLIEQLYDCMSLIPEYVRVYDGYDEQAEGELESFLRDIGCSSALTEPMPDSVDVLICDGDKASCREIGGLCGVGVDIGFPSLYDVNFMAKNVVGQHGILYVLEKIVNSRPLM